MAKAKFDIKTEATRPLYAYVGVVDRAAELVRGSVADAQKRLAEMQQNVRGNVREIDLEPAALQAQAATVVNARVEALSKEAQARRAAVEARVRKLQERAEVTYDDLVVRGETLVARIRNQETTKATVKEAKVTSAKAKTTRTQGKKATKSTASTAKRAARTTASTASNQASRPKSSAKATGTAARKTASSGAKATANAAKKVGD